MASTEITIKDMQGGLDSLVKAKILGEKVKLPKDFDEAVAEFNTTMENLDTDAIRKSKDATKAYNTVVKGVYNPLQEYLEAQGADGDGEAEPEGGSEEEGGEDSTEAAGDDPAPVEDDDAPAEPEKPAKGKGGKKESTKASTSKANGTGTKAASGGGQRGRPAGLLDLPPRDPQNPNGIRKGSKMAKAAELLHRKKGATLAEVAEAIGWAEGSVRGTMFRNDLNKTHGLGIKEQENKGKPNTFHLVLPKGKDSIPYREG